MTQDAKLDLLLDKMTSMEGKMTSIEGRLSSVEDELSSVKDGLSSVERRVSSVEEKVIFLDKKIDTVHFELKKMDHAILDEVERVHGILERHKLDRRVHMA